MEIWRRTKYNGRRLFKRMSRVATLVAKPPLLLIQRLPSAFLRNSGLFCLFLIACFLPSLLHPLSIRLAAFVQIFWSLCILGVGLSIALVHFLVEKELDAMSHGLLGRVRKRNSEVPLPRYLAFDGMVELSTLGVACFDLKYG